MTPETLKALKGSIEKWEKIVDCEGADKGEGNCDLCLKFIKKSDGCRGCPVRKKTSFIYCNGTPHIAWCDYCFGRNQESSHYRVFDQKSQNLAIAELEFLKSLLPSETK